jgi:hypothetical protein
LLLVVFEHAGEGDRDFAPRPTGEELLNQTTASVTWGVRRVEFYSDRLAARNRFSQSNRDTDTYCVTLELW